MLLVLALGAGISLSAAAQQVADTSYNPPIHAPSFEPAQGPRVAIDAAHLNFHTADGRYSAFASLLRRDGYEVVSNTEVFTAVALADIDILVIANPLHEQSKFGWAALPNLSAFTEAEIEALEQWVREGGALMLIADHMPIAGHAEALAAAFGVRFQNGFAYEAGGSGTTTFRRSDGTLPPNSISNGRHAEARIDSVTTFTGQAFRVDPDVVAQPLLVFPEGSVLFLPEKAWEFSESTPRIPAAYLLQGATLAHGQGRVAVFGEAAMFSAQLAGPEKRRMGMNNEAAGQNYRFALNVLQWLSDPLR